MEHKLLKDNEFWREIPAWQSVDKKTFYDYQWQLKNSQTSIPMMEATLKGLDINPQFYKDAMDAQLIAPMNLRITPYIFSLINWADPANDPIRRQFLPLGSQLIKENHPMHAADSLGEDADAKAPHLIHRYHDKALFLSIAVCPTYCSYCTRSRLIGGTTNSVEKRTKEYAPSFDKWNEDFEYIKNTPHLEDIVVSGGDTSLLTPEQVEYIGKKLFDIPHVRRIRYATKTLAVMPMKIVSHNEWREAILRVRDYGAKMGKATVIHTHSSHPNELTSVTKDAMDMFFREHFIVRNQGVIQNQVNNNKETLTLLTKRLSYLNIQPYYFYQHDMVPGLEHLRTPLHETVEIEKWVRGSTAGFNTPTFVCDMPGGGGKRHIATYDSYDRLTGISKWRAPSVKDRPFYYYDPFWSLTDEGREMWKKHTPEELIARL